MTERQLKRGIFSSVDELEQKIIEYIEINSMAPKLLFGQNQRRKF